MSHKHTQCQKNHYCYRIFLVVKMTMLPPLPPVYKAILYLYLDDILWVSTSIYFGGT